MLLLASLAFAGSLAGVTLPDSATVAGAPLVLNGMGLREKYFIDVYVGGLYLPSKTSDANKAINDDVAKRVVMHFIYGKVTKEQVVETFMEGFGDKATGPQKANVDKLIAVVPAEIVKGEELTLDYAPGVGTSLSFKGKTLVTVPGTDFMKMVWTVYLGPKPPTEALKSGLLGK